MGIHAHHFLRDYLLICLALLVVFIVAVIIVYYMIAKTAPPKKPKKKEIKFYKNKNKAHSIKEESYRLDEIE